MIKNIKSSYYIRLIFLSISEKKKFKLAKYNKFLQNCLGINIINYRQYSKRYIIYESNRKGIEQNSIDNILIFERDYLNGEKNGKGKEYYSNGNIRFEGEYLNGKKLNGNGYDLKNNVIYTLKDGNGPIKE